MGVLGAGLYSGDLAMDLRSTVTAVARLPYHADKLIEILCDSEPAAANNPDDQDHTTFWLVAADQFAKRAIICERVRDNALAIIDSGTDLAMLDKLGMDSSGLRKRQKMLLELRQRITAPAAPRKPRPVLKKPQALLMEIGDVLVYPTFGGRCRNPYFASSEKDRMGTMAPAWTRDGWSAMVIVDCGRAFDFLAWYRPLTVSRATVDKPTLVDLRGEVLWRLARPGTCSPVHSRRMGFEKLGVLPIDPDRLRQAFPGMRPGTRAAVSDISIANGLNVAPHVPEVLMPNSGEPANYSRGRPYPTILGIGQILSG